MGLRARAEHGAGQEWISTYISGGRRDAGKDEAALEAGGQEAGERGRSIHHEGMTRKPEEYNGGTKADDQGRGMTRLIAAPRAGDRSRT